MYICKMRSIEEEIKQKKFANAEQRAFINLFFTANFLELRQNQFFKEFNISGQQYNILRILKGQYPKSATVKLLIERMLDKSSNASRLVDKLKLKGLLSREQDPKDRRAVKVKITQEGLNLIDRINERMKREGPTLGITEDEAIMFSNLLDKIRNNNS